MPLWRKLVAVAPSSGCGSCSCQSRWGFWRRQISSWTLRRPGSERKGTHDSNDREAMGQLVFSEDGHTISPTPQALLQCDLATCSWGQGSLTLLLNLGRLVTALTNRIQQKWHSGTSEGELRCNTAATVFAGTFTLGAPSYHVRSLIGTEATVL